MTTTVKITTLTSHQGKAVRMRIVTPASKDPAVPLTEGHVWRDEILGDSVERTEYVHDGARIVLDEVDAVPPLAGATVIGDDGKVAGVVDAETGRVVGDGAEELETRPDPDERSRDATG